LGDAVEDSGEGFDGGRIKPPQQGFKLARKSRRVEVLGGDAEVACDALRAGAAAKAIISGTLVMISASLPGRTWQEE